MFHNTTAEQCRTSSTTACVLKWGQTSIFLLSLQKWLFKINLSIYKLINYTIPNQTLQTQTTPNTNDTHNILAPQSSVQSNAGRDYTPLCISSPAVPLKHLWAVFPRSLMPWSAGPCKAWCMHKPSAFVTSPVISRGVSKYKARQTLLEFWQLLYCMDYSFHRLWVKLNPRDA